MNLIYVGDLANDSSLLFGQMVEQRNFLKDNGVDISDTVYQLDGTKIYIKIEDDRLAMLFKLTYNYE